MPDSRENAFGAYLKDRRSRVDPAAFGFSMARRRTPGLRREEVAQRAHVSTTWYTWLEQGRGGAPSAEVLNRIAHALMLTEVEREHVFLLALGRAPEVNFRPDGSVTPRLQRVLDAMEFSPAYVRSGTWHILAWNRAASLVLTDYAALEHEQRNILRLLFGNARIRASMPHWETDARFIVAAFRADVARTGAAAMVKPLVDELCRQSPEFMDMWHDHDVQVTYGERAKQVQHRIAGLIALEYSGFAVDGRPDLGMVVYSPAGERDLARVQSLFDVCDVTSK